MTQITKDNGGRSAKEIIASIVEETKLPCRIRTLLGLAMPGLRTLDRGRLKCFFFFFSENRGKVWRIGILLVILPAINYAKVF